jgi:hypothetical protein
MLRSSASINSLVSHNDIISSFILRILHPNHHAASEYTWHKHGLIDEVYSGRLVSLASRYEYVPTGLE